MRALRNWRVLGVALVLGGATSAGAQVLMQPTEPPGESAALAAWFMADEPVVWNGIVFHQAGPQVFFDGNTMVRVGWFEGTPIYADTTIEPNSIVLVPMGGRMMQPYERVRDRDVAGTTGSRAPSFPVRPATTASGWGPGGDMLAPWGLNETAMAAGPPVGWETATYESLLGRMVSDWPARDRRASERNVEPRPVGTAGTSTPAPIIAPPPLTPGGASTVRQASETLGLWIEYEGARYQACGSAEVLAAESFKQTGTYRGFPVFSREGGTASDRIYLPSRTGFVAPYTRGPVERKPSGACAPVPVG
jgi:hypothetical protein